MKKVFMGLVCLFLVSGLAMSGSEKIPTLIKQGKSVDAFVLQGWKLIAKTSGDLNKDGLADIAGVIELNKKYDMSLEEAPPRVLFIAFCGADNQYRLSIQTERAILRADQGGVWGDPLEGISVDRGSILINFYGGSNYRWAYTYRFRYQNNGWFLIGATVTSYFTGTGEGTTEDYNLLTGKMIITKTDEQGKNKEESVNRGKKKLVNLKDLDVSAEEIQF